MKDGTPVGRIERLWRYPIKSLRGEALRTAEVEREGVAGDRRRALIVDSREHTRHGKPYRGKEHPRLHTTSAIDEAARMAANRGVSVNADDGGPFFDDAPLSIVVDVWLADAERLTGVMLEPERFRPNLFVRADPSFAACERDIVGVTIDAGAVALRVRAPIERCVTITYDVATGAPNPNILRDLARARAAILGVYADVLVPGTLRLGDVLTVRPSTDRPLDAFAARRDDTTPCIRT